MTKELNYEEAVKQLEDIVAKMENDELDIDQMSGQLKVCLLYTSPSPRD